MITKADLEKLAQTRLEDAQYLLQAGKNSSAYYLAGYSMELALKACIAKQFQSFVIPDKSFVDNIYSHNLDKLLGLSGLEPLYRSDVRVNQKLAVNWGIATKWNESSRYEFWDVFSATSLLDAIVDPHNGVFQWVKNYW